MAADFFTGTPFTAEIIAFFISLSLSVSADAYQAWRNDDGGCKHRRQKTRFKNLDGSCFLDLGENFGVIFEITEDSKN